MKSSNNQSNFPFRGLGGIVLILFSISTFAQKPFFTLVDMPKDPVIASTAKGAEDIKKGFEGGMVQKENGVYHLFVTERVSKPRTLLTRLGYWKSKDGNNWTKVSNLYTSTANPDGTDPRATLFAPMVVFNEKDDRWNIFYVAYIYDAWPAIGYNHQFGRIWRGQSKVKGRDGIGGPYEDINILLQPDGDMQAWEGHQGVDSFFPYKAGDKWYGFYGSASTEVMPAKQCSSWNVGLAEAPSLAGPWKRVEQGNPVNKKWMIENPIVYKIKDYYIAISDMLSGDDMLTIHLSKDGLNWEESQTIPRSNPSPEWFNEARTPLSLIDEGNGLYTVFFTAYKDYGQFAPVGKFTLKMEYK